MVITGASAVWVGRVHSAVLRLIDMVCVLGGVVFFASAGISQEAQLEAWQAETNVVVADPFKATIIALLDKPETVSLPIRKRIKALRAYYGDTTSKALWQDDKLAAYFVRLLKHSSKYGWGSR